MKKKLTKQISLGIDPYTGRRIRKRIYGDTIAEIRKKEKAAQQEFAKIGNVNRTTFMEYLDQWEQAYVANKAHATQKTFHTIKTKCEPLYYKRMCDITRIDLQQIVNDCWDAPTMCKALCGKLSSIWQSAMTDGIVQRNIAYKLDRPPTPKPIKRPLTKEEKEAIKIANFTPQERLLVDILFQFGLRPAEAFALDATSVDRKNRQLIISKSLSHDHNRPKLRLTKTQETRNLPIPDAILPKLHPLTRASTYFFVNCQNQLLSKRQADTLSRSVIDKINLALGGTDTLRKTDMTLYTFRHNRATDLYYMKGNLSTKAKAKYMGHSEEMFLRTYSHMLDEKEEQELLRQVVK